MRIENALFQELPIAFTQFINLLLTFYFIFCIVRLFYCILIYVGVDTFPSIDILYFAGVFDVAGLSQIITMDLHQKEIQGFFTFPVDNLRASPFLIQYIQEEVRLCYTTHWTKMAFYCAYKE